MGKKITPYGWIALLASLLLTGAVVGMGIASGDENQTAEMVSRTEASDFGSLWMEMPQGRVAPVSSYAGELLRKLTHKERYLLPSSWDKPRNAERPNHTDAPNHIGHAERAEHATHAVYLLADQWLLATQLSPQVWRTRPLIYTREGLQPLSSFFDSEGHYLLAGAVEQAYATAASTRSKVQRELLQVNERVHLLRGLLTSDTLSLYPRSACEALLTYLTARRNGPSSESDSLLQHVHRMQRLHIASHPIHSSQLTLRRLRAEQFYNRADIFRTVFRGYLLLGTLLLLTSLWHTRYHTQHPIKHPPRRHDLRPIRGLLLALILLLLLWHTVGILLRGYISMRAPWSNTYETMIYLGWCTTLSGLLFARRSPLLTALGTVMGGVILFVSHLNWLDPQITPLIPVLDSPWLMIHVSVVTASYGFFGLAALCGICLLVEIVLHGRPPRHPPRSTLHTAGELSMWIGLLMLGAGIFLGAVWAGESWGRYWGWDPKESWALVTLLVYTIATHARHIPRLDNAYLFSLFSLIGLSCVGMTFFGVNYLLSGLHAYGNSTPTDPTWLWISISILGLLLLIGGFRFFGPVKK